MSAHAQGLDSSGTIAPVLQVVDVTVTYGGVVAVDEVCLDVHRGQIHGLIGPNGAGKTSLIDAVTGFVRPSTGTVLLEGLDISRLSAHRRARSGVVRTFQNLELFDDMTVAENFRAAQARDGNGGDRVPHIAKTLGVDGHENTLVVDLPHGTRRLVSLARAALAYPRVLVLDEPAAGLDTSETRRLGEILLRLADEGLAILLVDHDMELVLRTCHRVTVLNFGRVLAVGTPADIRNDAAVRDAYLGTP